MAQSEPTHYLLLFVLVIIGLAVGVMIWSQSGPTAKPEPAGPIFEVGPGSLPPLGRADAPVKVIEFGDYACSFCGPYFKETISKLRDELVQNGQVQWFWRDFATLEPRSVAAAAAARCAAQQGAFWIYHDKLAGEIIDDLTLTDIADEIGLETEKFKECLKSDQLEALIKTDKDAAKELGVQAVPTFFINGERVVGAQPYEVLRSIIERQIGQSVSQ